jgi:hypothetical protein
MARYRTFSGEEIEIVIAPYTGGTVLVGGYAGTATPWCEVGNFGQEIFYPLTNTMTVTSPNHRDRCKYCNRLQVHGIVVCEGCGAPL